MSSLVTLCSNPLRFSVLLSTACTFMYLYQNATSADSCCARMLPKTHYVAVALAACGSAAGAWSRHPCPPESEPRVNCLEGNIPLVEGSNMATRHDEEQSTHLLAPTPKYLASVKVFPLIPNLKKDIMVSQLRRSLTEESLISTWQENIGTFYSQRLWDIP
jgi:hypothetical protein